MTLEIITCLEIDVSRAAVDTTEIHQLRRIFGGEETQITGDELGITRDDFGIREFQPGLE
jgi:hypothetical protein